MRLLVAVLVVGLCASSVAQTTKSASWQFAGDAERRFGDHHTHHAEVFGRDAAGYNALVLVGIDRVQATAPDGGGYFTGLKADPPESPIGYGLQLFGKPMIAPPRTTSYCSGATYGAFIEAMNMILPSGADRITSDRLEALRMQEPDGGRREDDVKFWGYWNDDNFGNNYALVQYSGIGEEVAPRDARPGDFLKIMWTKGGGHFVIFLGWIKGTGDEPSGLLYWSSQKATNGYADVEVALDKIRDVKFVRLMHPEKVFTYSPTTSVDLFTSGDVILKK